MLKIFDDRGLRSQSGKLVEVKAQDHQDASAEKENPTTQKKVNHVIRQVETPQILGSGQSVR